ncbi:hypothetical protein XANCAGTX0491_002946 [Xanthoria calcicola]
MGGNTFSRMILGSGFESQLEQLQERNTEYVSKRTGQRVPRPDYLGGPRPWDPPRRTPAPARSFDGPPHMMGEGMAPGTHRQGSRASRASRVSGAAVGGPGMAPPGMTPPGFANMATNGTMGGAGPGMHGAGGMGPGAGGMGPGAGGHGMPTPSMRGSGNSSHASRASGRGGGGRRGGSRGSDGGAGEGRRRRDPYATNG